MTPNRNNIPATARRIAAAFTLIEVLAALAMAAIILPAALGAMSSIFQSSQGASDRFLAVGLARSKLDELIATGEWDGGDKQGDFADEQAPGHSWVLDAAEVDETTRELKLTVKWSSRLGDREFSVWTFVNVENP